MALTAIFTAVWDAQQHYKSATTANNPAEIGTQYLPNKSVVLLFHQSAW